MKQSILLFFSFLIAIFLSAQVGINTNNPLAVFHIDGDGKNSATPTATELLNDVVITKDGNLGIGTINPPNKLSINATGSNTGLHLPNGASAGNVLVSDALGNSSWQSSAIQMQTMVTSNLWRIELITNTLNGSSAVLDQDFVQIKTFNEILIDKVPDTFPTYGWDKINQVYRVPSNGTYRIGLAVYFIPFVEKANYRAYIFVNGTSRITPGIISITDNGNHQAAYVMGLVKLKRDDIVDVRLFSSVNKVYYWAGSGHTFLLIESL